MLIAAARIDLIGPKRETTRVGFAVQKVEILLPHKRIGITNRRRCWRRRRRGWRRNDSYVRWIGISRATRCEAHGHYDWLIAAIDGRRQREINFIRAGQIVGHILSWHNGSRPYCDVDSRSKRGADSRQEDTEKRGYLVASTIISGDVERLADASGVRRIRVGDIAHFGATGGPVCTRKDVRLSAHNNEYTANHSSVVIDND